MLCRILQVSYRQTMHFTTLGLGPETLKAVTEVGYTVPTPIQTQAIPIVLMGRDVLGIAQTGTGKTASFTLPMIEILAQGRARARMPRSLILTPTRELAAQVGENFSRYGRYHKLGMALLVGGESFADQIRLLDRGVDVLIATPGRLLDLFQRGRILLSDVRILVIDEADRMLDMGFIPDVERIVMLLPRQRQTLFFSATMSPEVKRLADAFLNDPQEIRVALPTKQTDCVVQGLIIVDFHDKREALRHLLHKEQVRNAFIFCNRKRDVGVLHRSLLKHGFPAGMLHGDMPQPLRTETLERFRAGEISLLVCSDVAARGIDVAAMSHVFNFDVPIHAEDYIHRIGRTGRAGLSGCAFTIAIPEDGSHVTAIETLIGHPIPRVAVDGLEKVELVTERRRRRPDRERIHDQRRGRNERGERMEGSRNSGSRRHLLLDDGTGVPAMEHPDNVRGFGDHVPDFFLIDLLRNLEVPLFSPPEDKETGDETTGQVETVSLPDGSREGNVPEHAASGEGLSGRKTVEDSMDQDNGTGVAVIVPDTAQETGEKDISAVTATDQTERDGAAGDNALGLLWAGEPDLPIPVDTAEEVVEPSPKRRRRRPREKTTEDTTDGCIAAAPRRLQRNQSCKKLQKKKSMGTCPVPEAQSLNRPQPTPFLPVHRRVGRGRILLSRASLRPMASLPPRHPLIPRTATESHRVILT
ncbi:MAG: DEAD/DEAH box helicase [Rhodospirillaceae bacterium]|nr:MAG: DEAD/DEAH box helicase [Rhodospirillaceae bacterium]